VFGVWGLGFGVWGLEFGVEGLDSGFRVEGLEFEGSGIRGLAQTLRTKVSPEPPAVIS